jgi:hypothetical protein
MNFDQSGESEVRSLIRERLSLINYRVELLPIQQRYIEFHESFNPRIAVELLILGYFSADALTERTVVPIIATLVTSSALVLTLNLMRKSSERLLEITTIIDSTNLRIEKIGEHISAIRSIKSTKK